MSDMYFDTEKFDFNSLVDVVESTPEEFKRETMSAQQARETPDGGRVEDISDLSPLPESEEEADPNDNISDLLVSDAEREQAAEDFNYLPDNYVINFGGRNATKAEVNQIFEKVEEIEAKEEFVNSLFTDSEQGARWLYRESGVGLLEIDEKINQIVQEMNAAPNNAVYGEKSRELIAEQQKKEALYHKVDQALKVQSALEKNGVIANAEKVTRTMQKRYPDYDQVNAAILDDMKKAGVSLVSYEKSLNVWLADKLYKAKKTEITEDEHIKRAYERSSSKLPKSASTPATANRVAPSDAEAAKKAKLVHKMKTQGLTKEENRSLFNYLKD